MQHGVSHPSLTPGLIEARAYQLEAADEALSGSMMLVLPTAAGKTVVAWMVIADRLEREYHLTTFQTPGGDYVVRIYERN